MINTAIQVLVIFLVGCLVGASGIYIYFGLYTIHTIDKNQYKFNEVVADNKSNLQAIQDNQNKIENYSDSIAPPVFEKMTVSDLCNGDNSFNCIMVNKDGDETTISYNNSLL